MGVRIVSIIIDAFHSKDYLAVTCSEMMMMIIIIDLIIRISPRRARALLKTKKKHVHKSVNHSISVGPRFY